MTKLKTICFAVITAALAGCAAAPLHYDEESSRALTWHVLGASTIRTCGTHQTAPALIVKAC